MHSIAEVGTNVPAFLAKLWKMVEDPVTNDLISWSLSGTSFVIKDETKFARELLPMYYKHNNMASFIRQLNMYGFHKVFSPEAGTMKLETTNEIQFSHPFFIRGHSYLLDDIKRKMTVNKPIPSQLGERTPQVLGKVLTDVRQMKGRQENLDSKLTAMKLENGALWRELSVLRQKHIKQQQMVNKLIQFLVTLVQQNPNLFSMKQKYPRMIPQTNLIKMGNHQQHKSNADSPNNSSAGPIIHELDSAESLMDTVAVEAEVETEPFSPSEVSHYFLNESNDTTEDTVDETPFPIIKNKNSPETLIGIPEDTLIFKPSPSNQVNMSKTPCNLVCSTEQVKPHKIKPKSNYNINIATKNSTDNTVFNPSIQKTQQFIMKNQEKAKKNLQYHIQMNQRLIQKNREQINRSEELKLKQQKILKNQQEILKNRQLILKNRQDIISNQQEILENQEHADINNTDLHTQNNEYQKMRENQQKILRNQQLQKKRLAKKNLNQISLKSQQQHLEKHSQKKNKSPFQNSQFQEVPKSPLQNNQQLGNYTEQEILLEKLQQEIVPDSENIILDNNLEILDTDGQSVEILDTDGQSAYCEAEDPYLTAPIIVEVPSFNDLQEQQNSSPSVSQDLLLGSPLIMDDTVLTSQNAVSSTSIISSPSTSSSNMEVACLDESQVSSPNVVTSSAKFSKELDNHLDSMQSDLDNLKELLRSEGISLDANSLLGCFNEDPFSYSISDPVPADDPNRPKENNGNELMTYNPPLFDLTDLMNCDLSLPESPSEHQATDNSFEEIHTPQFVPQSLSFPTPAKKRKT